MTNPWKVISQTIGAQPIYAAYRLNDPNQTDHSGNREIATCYHYAREMAQAEADILNRRDAKREVDR